MEMAVNATFVPIGKVTDLAAGKIVNVKTTGNIVQTKTLVTIGKVEATNPGKIASAKTSGNIVQTIAKATQNASAT